MKDPTDTYTADLHPVPKRRGRTPTGKAMTAAERKRRQRVMDKERLIASSSSDGKPVTVTGLIEYIAWAARKERDDWVMDFARELADRIRATKEARDSHGNEA